MHTQFFLIMGTDPLPPLDPAKHSPMETPVAGLHL